MIRNNSGIFVACYFGFNFIKIAFLPLKNPEGQKSCMDFTKQNKIFYLTARSKINSGNHDENYLIDTFNNTGMFVINFRIGTG